MGLFRKKNREVMPTGEGHSLLTAYDRMKFYAVDEAFDDGAMFELADSVRNNRPIIVNFAKAPVEIVNYALAFLSGVVYALDGKVIKTQEKVFLFASGSDYADGSLTQYVEDSTEGSLY